VISFRASFDEFLVCQAFGTLFCTAHKRVFVRWNEFLDVHEDDKPERSFVDKPHIDDLFFQGENFDVF
jgi:hypothetical protein